MDGWTFIVAQFPASYLFTGIWYEIVLPLMPNWVQHYRRYDVVRNVDYLEKGSFYTQYTWFLFFAFILFYRIIHPANTFPLWFSFMSWLNVICMELGLQFSGKRKLNFRKSDYWSGSNLTSILVQSLREGAVTFGLPALECCALLEKDVKPIFWFGMFALITDWGAFFYLLYENLNKKQKRDYGSTNVTGRRSILDTIAYRVAEIYVIYYIYTLYPTTFWDMKDFIIYVTIHRSVALFMFFSVGTYAGLTWIDCGPKVECKDHALWIFFGLVFRTVESTFSGYPKTIALTVLLMKLVEK